MSESDGVATQSLEEEDSQLNVSDIEAALFDNVTPNSTEVAEAEPGEATEEGTEEEEETEEAPEPETEPVDSPGVKKRIDGLLNRTHEAEAKVIELEKTLSSQEAASQTQEPEAEANRFTKVTDPTELTKLENEARAMEDWLTVNPDGGTFQDENGEEHVIDMDRAREIALTVRRDLRDNIPTRREDLRQRQQITAQATEIFPWMKDQNSPEFTEVATSLARSPRLKRFYDEFNQAPLFMGYVMEGIRSVQARSKKAPATRAPAVPTPSTRSTTQPKSSKRNSNALLERAKATGDRGAVTDYLETII